MLRGPQEESNGLGEAGAVDDHAAQATITDMHIAQH
jgi:hypothetical protein